MIFAFILGAVLAAGVSAIAQTDPCGSVLNRDPVNEYFKQFDYLKTEKPPCTPIGGGYYVDCW